MAEQAEAASTSLGPTGIWFIDTINAFWQWAQQDWELALSLFLLVAFYFWWRGMVREADSRSALLAFLRNNQAGNAYKLLVSWLLDRTDRWVLSDDDYKLKPADRPAWTGKLLDRMLLLALAYPFLSLILQWTALGDPGRIGPIEVIPAEPADWKRKITISCIMLVIIFIAALEATHNQQRLERTVSLHLGLSLPLWPFNVTLIVLIAATGAGAANFAIQGYYSFQVEGWIFFCFSIIAVIPFFRAIPSPASHPNGSSVLPPFAGAVAICAAVAVAVVFEVAVGFTVAVAVAVAVAFALVSLAVILRDLNNPTAPRLTLWVIWMLAVLPGAVWWIETPTERGASLIVLIVALPLLNALFDFGSLGLTRFALRRGIDKPGFRSLAWGAFDLGAAAVLFLALGCACVAYVHLLNSVAAAPLWALGLTPDEPGLFNDLWANPQAFWWLYLTFLSTLLPTIVHGAIAVWSIGPAVLRPKSRLWIARQLERSTASFHIRFPTLVLLSLWSAFAVAVPVIMLVWAGGWVAEVHPEWGGRLLDFFEGFYHLLPGT